MGEDPWERPDLHPLRAGLNGASPEVDDGASKNELVHTKSAAFGDAPTPPWPVYPFTKIVWGKMWSRIEEKITFYHELSPEEQRDPEQHVREHPEMAPLLEEAQAFAALLQEAHLLHVAPPGDEALAYYIATRHVSRHPLPASLQDAFARIESRLTADASLRTRYEELARRMATLEAASDPVHQFERLSGRRIAPAAQPAPTTLSEAVAPPVVIYRLWGRLGQWAAAAVVFCLVFYGALAFVSQTSRSDLDRLAAFEDFEAEGLRIRGGVTSPGYVSSEELYDRALKQLRGARKQTLGLFTHSDQEQLNEAAGLLRHVVAQDPEESSLRAEANFLLAKIHLAQEDVGGARAALQAVLADSGWKASEAQTLLEELEALSN